MALCGGVIGMVLGGTGGPLNALEPRGGTPPMLQPSIALSSGVRVSAIAGAAAGPKAEDVIEAGNDTSVLAGAAGLTELEEL